MGEKSLWKKNIALITILSLLTVVAFQAVAGSNETSTQQQFKDQVGGKGQHSRFRGGDGNFTPTDGNFTPRDGNFTPLDIGAGEHGMCEEKLTEMLDELEEAGIDVSEARAALEAGEEITKEMMESLREQAEELGFEFPGFGNRERITHPDGNFTPLDLGPRDGNFTPPDRGTRDGNFTPSKDIQRPNTGNRAGKNNQNSTN
ncbi:MAG: hypothetical protein GYA51_18835 [Candidatus Methanofastidiosa archaeon]|nr:hypothetical protein [Candidatus Methanofastidiosa archaeon]